MQTTNTLDYLISQGFSDTVLERFWEKVNKTETCWLWTGPLFRGRGMLYKMGRKMMYANRVSWMIHHGDIPTGLNVLHTCDVGHCVRPDHLFLGTQTDNIADMMAKGRQAKGESKALSKLTEE